MKKILQFVLILLLALCLVYGSKAVALSKQSLTLWFENLVPSMFVSMVLLRLLYKQQLLQSLFPSFFCRIFGLDQHAMALVISSMLLGFPNGSQFIEEAYQAKEIDQKAARRLFPICCFPTPGFVILSCGEGIFHSISIGFLLYLSQIVYGFLCLWCTRKHVISCTSTRLSKTNSLMKDLGSSMMESGTSLFMIGGYLMIFMSLSGILFSFLPAALRFPLSIVAEFSSGTFLIQQAHLSLYASLMATCALLGFGGFCVHMQIYSLCETSKASYSCFFRYRLLQTIISTVIFCVFLYLFV